MFRNQRWASRALVAAALFVLFSSSAYAQATRTWVSGVGDDANPCSRTAPCKTFAGAISKTAAGGEISVLDPGGFGGVTITKSITINNVGGEAGVLVSGTNAIIINAAATDRVTLRGLNIEGLGTGIVGVRILSAAEVVIEDCQIQGFRGAGSNGILVAPSAGFMQVSVRNTTINANGQNTAGSAGILLKPTGTGAAVLDAVDVVVNNNGSGIIADASTGSAAWASVRDSQITGNAQDGVLAISSSAGTARVAVQSSTLQNNGFTSGLTTIAALRASGSAASIRFLDNVITVNKVGVAIVGGGQVISYGGNVITANSNNGTFTTTSPTQ